MELRIVALTFIILVVLLSVFGTSFSIEPKVAYAVAEASPYWENDCEVIKLSIDHKASTKSVNGLVDALRSNLDYEKVIVEVDEEDLLPEQYMVYTSDKSKCKVSA